MIQKIHSCTIDWYYRLLTWKKIIPYVLKRGIFQTLRDLHRYPWLRTMLKVNRLISMFGKNRPPRYQKATAILVSGVVTGLVNILEGLFLKPETAVIHEDMVPPEVFRAMGLSPYMAEMNGLLLPMIDPHVMEKYIDASESEGIPPDICSLPKSTMGLFLRGENPPAKVIITSNLPCDGGMNSYSVIEKKTNLPVFRLDVPQKFTDPRAVTYFVEEMKRMIHWLEEHTPGKMDWDRLRDICEQRNRMVEVELELWELLRVRPAPLASEAFWIVHLWYFNLFPGSPHSTKMIEQVVELGRQNLARGISAVKNETYRAMLWNPPLMHFIDVFNWAEQTYGVSLIMDSMSFNRLPMIDTRSNETMLEGLGRNIMNGPMARHTRGPSSNYLEDIFHLRKQFDLDMLWVAGHIGCKSTMALNGMLRETCREAGLPLLIIEYDLSDPRVVSKEGIMEQVDHFMENVMKAKKLQE